MSVETLHGAFRSIDVDGKGTITPAQYRRIFDNLAPHVPKAVSSQIMLLGEDWQLSLYIYMQLRGPGSVTLSRCGSLWAGHVHAVVSSFGP